jgi:hypothetical protein
MYTINRIQKRGRERKIARGRTAIVITEYGINTDRQATKMPARYDTAS